jgi:hypothetical protein
VQELKLELELAPVREREPALELGRERERAPELALLVEAPVQAVAVCAAAPGPVLWPRLEPRLLRDPRRLQETELR